METYKQKQSFLLLIGLSLLLALGCDQLYCSCESSPSVYQYNDSVLTEVRESASGAIADWERFDEYHLYESKGESYRFLYIAPFGAYKKIYRLEDQGSVKVFTIKTFNTTHDSLGGRSISVDQASRNLSYEEWVNFKDLLEKNCFWHIPVLDEIKGLDGSNWLLEGFTPTPNRCQGRNFHSVYRWTPDHASQDFLAICDGFRKLDLP